MQITDRTTTNKGIWAIAIICLLCQVGLAPHIAIASGHPNFALIFAAVVALTTGGRTGVICGFAAGLVFDLATTGPVGLMAFLLTALSYALGNGERDRLSDEISSTALLLVAGSFAVCLCYNLAMYLTGLSPSLVDALVFRTLPTLLLTILCSLPFVYAVMRGHRGTGVGLSGRKASRFDIPR